MKSLSVRPLILCVQVVISTFPQARKMSGWCPSSSALSGDTPPRQGTHVLAARSDIVEVILPLARATLSPLPSRPLELFEMRKEPAPCEAKPIRLLLEECSTSVFLDAQGVPCKRR